MENKIEWKLRVEATYGVEHVRNPFFGSRHHTSVVEEIEHVDKMEKVIVPPCGVHIVFQHNGLRIDVKANKWMAYCEMNDVIHHFSFELSGYIYDIDVYYHENEVQSITIEATNFADAMDGQDGTILSMDNILIYESFKDWD